MMRSSELNPVQPDSNLTGAMCYEIGRYSEKLMGIKMADQQSAGFSRSQTIAIQDNHVFNRQK